MNSHLQKPAPTKAEHVLCSTRFSSSDRFNKPTKLQLLVSQRVEDHPVLGRGDLDRNLGGDDSHGNYRIEDILGGVLGLNALPRLVEIS